MQDSTSKDSHSRCGAEIGGIRAGYCLYTWHGKCKWAYLLGVYLVDPKYEREFLENEKHRA